MEPEKEAHDDAQTLLPIPTYEEAISRPSSSQSFLGSAEVSHDAERQGLLRAPRGENYHAPTVESARSSLDLLPSSGINSSRGSIDSLRAEIMQMDILEPGTAERHGNRLSKRISSLTQSLSTINLPFRRWMSSSQSIWSRVPAIPLKVQLNWILAGRFFALLLVMLLVYILFISDVFSIGQRYGSDRQIYDPESVKIYVQDHIDEGRIEENLEHLTQYDHVAGTEGSYFLAEWIKRHFEEADLENPGLERFDVYLNYPRKGGRKVAIIEPPELAWEAKINEEPAYSDPLREQTAVFHGHSKSGNVKGPLIYANYGSKEDFKFLRSSGISVTGSIVLVRYYGSQADRALKVKAAELAGAVGCIIYSDPADDGFQKGEPFPKGRYMPQDGVQRGTVALSSWVVGDVLSPGFASLPGERHRISKENNAGLNKIPSIPLAWRDAQVLLQSLKGHGKKVEGDFVGGVPDVDWFSGDQKSPTIRLVNEQDEEARQPIYNVLGKISGREQPEKAIIVGNHRDAWCFGGADPGSGTAVFLEVIRIFGELRKHGWRPLRSIEFASWDGEEYNLIGSTEHVESRIDELKGNGFAYLNVDVAVIGSELEVSGCPVFQKSLLYVLDRVWDPTSNKTLRSLWEEKNAKIQGLGAGSDYVAFQDIAGTSSLDMGFGGLPYPYHSCYDNFDWMSKYGDPGFRYHGLLARVWALLILDLSDNPILPFDFENYAHAVQGYVKGLEQYAKKAKAPRAFNLRPLYDAGDEFALNAKQFHEWDRAWTDIIYNQGGFESNVMSIKRVSHNTRMGNFETNLLDDEGLPGREQFKHVIFAPQAWDSYAGAFFPGVRDAIDNGDWKLAQAQVEKVARMISFASRKLNH